MGFTRLRAAALTAFVAVAAACADEGPTAPGFLETPQLAETQDLRMVDGRLALEWADELDADVAISRTIGTWGGTLELPKPGLRLWVPPFALKENTELTMTARAGEDVAFDFGPHGTQFEHPVWVSIDLTMVDDGKELVDQLRGCVQTTSTSNLVSGLVSAEQGKKGKKKKKKKSDDDDDNGNDDDDDNDDNEDDSNSNAGNGESSGGWGSLTGQSAGTCAFSWFEKLKGMDSVYLGEKQAGSVVEALQTFEVWLVGDRWLTFATDHFSGYALAM